MALRYNQSTRAMRALLLLLVGLAAFPRLSPAAPVYLDPVSGREWRQVKDTVGFSYNTMNTDANGDASNGCSASTGACLGNLGGGSGPLLVGWMWATELDVRHLFSNFSGVVNIPGFDPLPGSPFSYFEGASIWAPALIDLDGSGIDEGLFDATYDFLAQGLFITGVEGKSRTLGANSFTVLTPSINDSDPGALIDDRASTQILGFPLSSTSTTTGFWLWREQGLPVEAPPTLPLVLMGLIALLCRVRARSVTPARQ